MKQPSNEWSYGDLNSEIFYAQSELKHCKDLNYKLADHHLAQVTIASGDHCIR